ncbi:MAG: PQQ-dependent sugar dehydrogenase [Cytophagales bacterium]|nr:PQQ-dependent sugar dehydrogenase [Cytophagales bacterium]
MKKCTAVITILVIFLMTIYMSFAATLPSGYIETRIAQNINPTDIEFSPDGRLFLCEKNGIIKVYKNDTWLTKPFLSISGITDANNERGLQSIAFDPDFADNQYFYVFFTKKGSTNSGTPISTNSVNMVMRYTASGDTALPNSGVHIIHFGYLSNAGNHNGGGMVFGNDGKLYLATGENANTSYSQSASSLMGKILRINKDGTIPTDNPYYNTFTGINRSIYGLGLRNPFKMAIQSTTGMIFVNDVGGGSAEEINRVQSGKNFGWPGIEGYRAAQTMPANYADPVFAYTHSDGCSITAGAFYNPASPQFPNSIVGRYFFADYCNGYVKMLNTNANTITGFITGINRPLDVAVDRFGALYYVARAGLGGGSVTDNTSSSNGEIWKVQYTGSGAVSFSVQPEGVKVSVGTGASFVCSANGNQPISYQWYKNNVSIAGANASSYTLTTTSLSDNGAQYKVHISNYFSTLTSNIAVLTVVSNALPNAIIATPTAGTKYSGGDIFTITGRAIDTEDGTLTGSSLTWRVDFHHNTHIHPALDNTTGSGITYEVPTSGETSDTVWLRIHLKATDSQGAIHQTFMDILPNTTNIALKNSIQAGNIQLDGKNVGNNYAFRAVMGIVRQISAEDIIFAGGSNYSFSGWNTGTSVRAINIVPNATDTLIIANYGLIYTSPGINNTTTPGNTTTTTSNNTTTTSSITGFNVEQVHHLIFPNPSSNGIFFISNHEIEIISVTSYIGSPLQYSFIYPKLIIDNPPQGVYFITYYYKNNIFSTKAFISKEY